MRKSNSGVTRTSSGRLRRLADPTGPALKRSFEVEEVEAPNSTPSRRVQPPMLRASVASSTQKFQELGARAPPEQARHADSFNQRSPKAALRRVEPPGPKAAEPVSRRTELSIDISSKQVETASTPGQARFGLKRAEALAHKTPELAPRRTEITLLKSQEAAHRRMELPASKAPETTDAAPKRVELQVSKPVEAPAAPTPPQALENSEPSLQSRLEPRPQPPVAEPPPRSLEAFEAAPGDMADTPREGGLKQAPAPRNEKAPVDFGYVGIDSILEQMRRKAMKQGFEFNIMVVGQSGLGKSTLINTLFKSKISRKSVQPASEELPFAVVGSDHEYQVNGKRILGRKTKWGTIEVENTTHCEFAYLRDLLIRTHMQNIKDITSSIHFEAYRVKRLHEGSSLLSNGVEDKDPDAQEM
ncbi:septin-9 [Echinops telfairi]|uniref:Septin-9 n=1 Tax=Echinops telfairi TaxID=9371 RepID=A0AC55DUN1_ECHTE|nr:septin-9 [Echinops telfairi]